MNFYKFAVAGLSMLAATVTVSAQDYTETLTVGTYSEKYEQYVDTITPGQTKYIPVNVVLSQEGITGLQFDIWHSEGISLTKKVIKNPDMIPASDQVIVTPEVSEKTNEGGERFVLSRVMVVSSQNDKLGGTEGNLMQIEIEAAETAFNRFPKLELEVENIVMTAPGEGGDGIGLYAPDMSSYVVMGIDKLALSCPDENLEIMPGGECTITVAMENSVKVAGLETDIVLPEGFTLKGLENNDVVTFCERAEGGDQQVFDRGDNRYHLLAFRYDGENLTNELSGDLFTFTVVAPETLDAKDYSIELDKFVISFGSNESTISYDGQGCTITIANKEELDRVEANEAAYNENLAEIAELQAALDEAVADIKANYPDFDVETAAAEIQAIIDDQKAQADAALEAVANEGTYENAVDSAAVLEAIEAMGQSAIDKGITSITVEELGNARIYTTTGVQVSEPVKGAINIVVTEDGKVFKLHIK